MNKRRSYAGIWGAGVVALVGFATVAFAMFAHAQTAPTVSCSGAVSGDQIIWTATSTGGVAPYAFLWSGSGIASGTTSTAVTATYAANGTYTAMIQSTDASSSVATSSCSETVSSYPVTSTGTLNVYVSVNNNAGGSAVPANFAVSVSGAGATPASFGGNASGTAVTVDASSTYSVGVSTLANYSASTSGNCTGPIAAGAVGSCTVAETYVAPPIVTPTSTPTPPLPRFYQPMFSVGGNGQFLAHGMTVTSVASGSFQGSVWGITYTVVWNGNLFPQFYLRDGNEGGVATNPVTQLKVGDEVGVSGFVSSANPMTVQANVVRDYSIMALRPDNREGQSSSPFYNGIGQGGENGQGNGEAVGANAVFGTPSGTTPTFTELNARLQELMSQFRNIQNLYQEQHGGGAANGNSDGNGGNSNGNGGNDH